MSRLLHFYALHRKRLILTGAGELNRTLVSRTASKQKIINLLPCDKKHPMLVDRERPSDKDTHSSQFLKSLNALSNFIVAS
jgi:hypothetical protein